MVEKKNAVNVELDGRTKHYYSKMNTSQRRKVRNSMVEAQGQKCWYCEQYLQTPPPIHIANYPFNMRKFPKGMLKHPIHLHHDHHTDECLGAVHAQCNMYLWEVEGE